MADEKTDDVLYDLGRLAENSAVMDHEIQRLVVLLRSAPDKEIREYIIKAWGPEPPDFLVIAEDCRKMAIAFLRLNEAVDRFLREIQQDMSPEQLPSGDKEGP